MADLLEYSKIMQTSVSHLLREQGYLYGVVSPLMYVISSAWYVLNAYKIASGPPENKQQALQKI